jgi:hypothetical protein
MKDKQLRKELAKLGIAEELYDGSMRSLIPNDLDKLRRGLLADMHTTQRDFNHRLDDIELLLKGLINYLGLEAKLVHSPIEYGSVVRYSFMTKIEADKIEMKRLVEILDRHVAVAEDESNAGWRNVSVAKTEEGAHIVNGKKERVFVSIQDLNYLIDNGYLELLPSTEWDNPAMPKYRKVMRRDDKVVSPPE